MPEPPDLAEGMTDTSPSTTHGTGSSGTFTATSASETTASRTTTEPDDTTGEGAESTGDGQGGTTRPGESSEATSADGNDDSTSTGEDPSTGDASTGTSECGNGIVEGDEQCDEGDETAECDRDCTFQECGDGYHNEAAELCDGDPLCSSSCWYLASCNAILQNDPEAASGVYTIDPDGRDDEHEPVSVLCEMDVDGGGWTLVASSRGVPLRDQAAAYHDDLRTIVPEGSERGVWNGLRSVFEGGRTDVRFTCSQDVATDVLDVDLSFYDVVWYHEFTTGTDAESCFSEENGEGADDPPPARRNNVSGDSRPVGDPWDAGYLEGEDFCDAEDDFTVDFDDRGMDVIALDGTDWGQDDEILVLCGSSSAILTDPAWHIWVRGATPQP